MLVQLNIADFAIIKDLEITLEPGLNILSGETGAGKSIIINAMNLILGGRASADLIRSGCKEARVEALFSFPENRPLTEMLMELELPFDGELLIKRVVSLEGRNRISINGAIATLQMLSRLSSLLISISGQYAHQLLLKPDNHLYVLDDFGELTAERLALTDVFNQCRSTKDKICRLKKQIAGIWEKQELSRFQIREIEDAGLIPGEDDILAEEKGRLQHAEELLEIVTEGYQSLYEKSGSVLSVLAQCAKRMDRGSEVDSRLGQVRDRIRETEINLEDIALSLRDLQNAIHMDPDRLETVTERIALLNRLKRKYGPTLSDVIQFKDGLTGLVVDLEGKNESLELLEREFEALSADVTARASVLSGKRKEAAERLEKAVENELQYLHMQETRFLVKFEGDQGNNGIDKEGDETWQISSEGIDHPEFMISANVGEELRPLYKIASGGELSRIMLAIKTILAQKTSVETIIFDEVDSGISGATAEVVGEKVLSLADYHQIICITHLPQIASKGRTHFLVRKAVSGNRTFTSISGLDEEDRVQEIARLLGGKEITRRAIAHAREMLG